MTTTDTKPLAKPIDSIVGGDIPSLIHDVESDRVIRLVLKGVIAQGQARLMLLESNIVQAFVHSDQPYLYSNKYELHVMNSDRGFTVEHSFECMGDTTQCAAYAISQLDEWLQPQVA